MYWEALVTVAPSLVGFGLGTLFGLSIGGRVTVVHEDVYNDPDERKGKDDET